ncbi:MAG: hypothetical protein DME44_07785 [Verrucomicrobia bacterium]|nr:MAG: hypothetical protein DME44_07785 [Verrucomicrobiota bacterium]
MVSSVCTRIGIRCAATRVSRKSWPRLRPSSSLSLASAALRDENWLHGRVGVPDSERAEPQRLILNVTMWPEIAEPRDDIGNTVNYSEVAASLRQFVNRHACKLIETLAEEIAAHLLAQFNLRKVEVEVRKFVLPDANYVSVTAVREREAT